MSEPPPEAQAPPADPSSAPSTPAASAMPPAGEVDVGAGVQREGDTYGLILPFGRVKRLMKQEGNVKAVTGEASYLVARAAELFLDKLAERGGRLMAAENRKVLLYKDVAQTVRAWGPLEFLRDIVPMKVSAATLLQQASKQGHNGMEAEGGDPMSS